MHQETLGGGLVQPTTHSKICCLACGGYVGRGSRSYCPRCWARLSPDEHRRFAAALALYLRRTSVPGGAEHQALLSLQAELTEKLKEEG